MKYFLVKPFTGKGSIIPQIEDEPSLNQNNGKRMFYLVRYSVLTDYVCYFSAESQIVSLKFFDLLKRFGYPQSRDYWESIELIHNDQQKYDYILLHPPIIELESIDFSQSNLLDVDMLMRVPVKELHFASLDEYSFYLKSKDRMHRIRARSIKKIGAINYPWVKTALSRANNFLSEEVIAHIKEIQLTGIDFERQTFMQSG